MTNCNLETGACGLPTASPASVSARSQGAWVRYIGDPMCSWCWGLSPMLRQIAECADQRGLGFSVTMGGLRAGGGDPWTGAFKDFLRREWEHIASATRQPFGYTLLDLPDFNYDTEPSCRAVAVAQLLLTQRGAGALSILGFLHAVQRKFYVDGADPKESAFYGSVCADTGLDFDAFKALFASSQGRLAAQAHFAQCREWGVRSFPTLMLEFDGTLAPIAVGYVTATEAIARITRALSREKE